MRPDVRINLERYYNVYLLPGGSTVVGREYKTRDGAEAAARLQLRTRRKWRRVYLIVCRPKPGAHR